VLLGKASMFAKQLGLNGKEIQEEMMKRQLRTSIRNI
jgi:hypothetical protein